MNESNPNLPSPFKTKDNREFVIAVTKENKYAIIPVTLGNDRDICQQLVVDTADFPQLAQTGLHSGEQTLLQFHLFLVYKLFMRLKRPLIGSCIKSLLIILLSSTNRYTKFKCSIVYYSK